MPFLKSLKDLASQVSLKQVGLWVLSLVLYKLFHTRIETILDQLVVKHVLSFCPSTPTNDAVILMAGLFVVGYGISKITKNYILSPNLLFLIFSLTDIYSIYRFWREVWAFTPFSILPTIKYLDIIYLLGISTTILLIRNLFTKHTTNTVTQNSFYIDEPLGKEGKDLLNYQNYAKAVCNRLEDCWFQSAFAIGITGPWGAGKTSFTDLIKRNLQDDGKIIIDFNTWNSLSPDYRRCTSVDWIPTGPGSARSQKRKIAEASRLFIDFIQQKDLDGFLYEMVSVERREEKLVAFHVEIAQDIFESLDKFEQFLYEQDKSKSIYLLEFIELFKKVKEKEFKSYIEFEFRQIPDKRSNSDE